jgi:hypothetical protein
MSVTSASRLLVRRAPQACVRRRHDHHEPSVRRTGVCRWPRCGRRAHAAAMTWAHVGGSTPSPTALLAPSAQGFGDDRTRHPRLNRHGQMVAGYGHGDLVACSQAKIDHHHTAIVAMLMDDMDKTMDTVLCGSFDVGLTNCTLPALVCGAPGRNRTYDLRFRKRLPCIRRWSLRFVKVRLSTVFASWTFARVR